MANLYSPESLGIKAPAGGFQTGGWYQGRQFWGGQFSDPGVENPLSNSPTAGKTVSPEVNAASAKVQGVTPQAFETYLADQRKAGVNVTPASIVNPSATPSTATPTVTTPTGSPGTPGGIGITPPASLNLPDLYKSLSTNAGITDLEAKLNKQEADFISAKSKINDNPFLSEGTRTGRIAKLTSDYNDFVKNDQNLLAMKKQDIQTQLDIATKQFDINSQSAKQSLDQFNTLLSSGALSGASGADIASITASTGISSDMITAAINAQKQKDVSTSLTTVDDGKNVYAVLIDTKTGNVIKKSVIGGSKPSTAQPSTAEKTSYYSNALRQDAARGLTLDQIFKLYTGYLEPNTIFYLYNANSSYGAAKETPEQLAKYGVTSKQNSTQALTDALTNQ